MYIQMEYCELGTLHQFLKKKNGAKIYEGQILGWALQLCEAVKELVLKLHITSKELKFN